MMDSEDLKAVARAVSLLARFATGDAPDVGEVIETLEDLHELVEDDPSEPFNLLERLEQKLYRTPQALIAASHRKAVGAQRARANGNMRKAQRRDQKSRTLALRAQERVAENKPQPAQAPAATPTPPAPVAPPPPEPEPEQDPTDEVPTEQIEQPDTV